MTNIEKLRKEAARARRLLSAISDPLSAKLLTDYSDDCDAQADRLERMERGDDTDADRS